MMETRPPRRLANLPTFVLAIGLLAVGPRPGVAQDTTHAPTSSVRRVGRILGVFDGDSGQPIDSAEVIDLLGDQTFRTQAAGLIGLAGFRSQHDSAAVRIRKVGFGDTAFVVMLGSADTTPVQVFLRRATVLETIVSNATGTAGMTGTMREFDSRMHDKTLHGKYVTPAELPINDSRSLGDVLFTIGYGRGTLRCQHGIHIFVNGRATNVVSTDDDAAGVDPKEPANHYEAIEFYPGQGPLEYTGCSLLLWTRGM